MKLAVGKKAKAPLILELKDISSIADYFVICSGDSSTQVKAIAEAIDDNFSKDKMFPVGKEGLSAARWVLMDYGDIVIHIFNAESRAFYDLERLWLDAPRIPAEKEQPRGRKKEKV